MVQILRHLHEIQSENAQTNPQLDQCPVIKWPLYFNTKQ